MTEDVSIFLEQLKHPFLEEIHLLRKIILASNTALIENIKWNAPNYSIHAQDRLTMRIHPPKKQLQLIFHFGAKKTHFSEQPAINDSNKLLNWKSNDRAVVTFDSKIEIQQHSVALTELINNWIALEY